MSVKRREGVRSEGRGVRGRLGERQGSEATQFREAEAKERKDLQDCKTCRTKGVRSEKT